MTQAAAKPSKRATAALEPKTRAKGAAASAKPVAAPRGRQSKYTPEIAAEICQRLSTGEPLRQICRSQGIPEWRTIYDWVARDPLFAAQVARAREEGYDAMAEETLDIANTPHLGTKKVFSSGGESDSVTVTEEDMLGHRKLQIETRLKLLACWNPKKYGTKVALGGDAGNPIKIEAHVEADTYLAAILKNIELKKQVAASE
jgi:hypothetical protein